MIPGLGKTTVIAIQFDAHEQITHRWFDYDYDYENGEYFEEALNT